MFPSDSVEVNFPLANTCRFCLPPNKADFLHCSQAKNRDEGDPIIKSTQIHVYGYTHMAGNVDHIMEIFVGAIFRYKCQNAAEEIFAALTFVL